MYIYGWWFQPLWKIWKSVGMIIPNIYIYIYIIKYMEKMFQTTKQVYILYVSIHSLIHPWDNTLVITI